LPIPTYSTAATILDQARSETRVGSSPVATALQDTAMLRALSDYNAEFVNYPQSVGMLGWSFLDDETIIETKVKTNLDGAISSGDATMTLNSVDAWTDPADLTLEAGFIRSANDIFDYFTFEDIDTLDLQAVDGVQEDHADDEEVHKIYKCPSDFGYPRALFRESRSLIYYHQNDALRQVPLYPYYTTKTLTSGTNGFSATFLVFPHDVSALDWKLQYQKQATAISATATSVNAPDGHGRRFLVERLKSYIFNVKGETADSQQALALAEREINKCGAQYSIESLQPSNNLVLYW
jgi:hypothetical protein